MGQSMEALIRKFRSEEARKESLVALRTVGIRSSSMVFGLSVPTRAEILLNVVDLDQSNSGAVIRSGEQRSVLSRC